MPPVVCWASALQALLLFRSAFRAHQRAAAVGPAAAGLDGPDVCAVATACSAACIGKCTVTTEGGVDKETCESLCGGPAPSPPAPPADDKYKCHEGECKGNQLRPGFPRSST